MNNLICKCGLDPKLCLCPRDLLLTGSTFDSNVDLIVDYLEKEIKKLKKLSEVSNGPVFYLGQIHALQSVLTNIYKQCQ
jgi:hypothetical protein